MPLDYRKQYEPHQLEPLWPNFAIRLAVASLLTLAILVILAVLPVLLETWGLKHWIEIPEPANARETPIHIRPEWYFLALFQWLKLFPSEFLGLSGKTMGVLSQAAVAVAAVILPFFTRGKPQQSPSSFHDACTTLSIGAFWALTFLAVWPPRPLFLIVTSSGTLLFFVMMLAERRRVRRILGRHRDSD